MTVEFQDYYKTLGVEKNASKEDIQRAYRKLARKFHPDINKSPDAEDGFKRIGEAYEVLKDPEKRKLYDKFGKDWKEGGMQPPPGWEQAARQRRGGQSRSFQFEDRAEFSDFFNMLFGEELFEQAGGGRYGAWSMPGRSQEAELTISLADAYYGSTKQITLQTLMGEAGGRAAPGSKTYQVKIPKGIQHGSVIRLTGQGEQGTGDAPAGDLLLHVRIQPDPRFRVDGDNFHSILPVSPWEAVLGAKVGVETMDGKVSLSVPKGAQNGQRLRLRGKGMPKKTGGQGDLIVELDIRVPERPGSEELALFERLANVSTYDPRGGSQQKGSGDG